MSRRLSTALLFMTAVALLPPDAHAGFKSGGAPVHPVAPSIHPIHRHAAPLARGRSHLAGAMHRKRPHGFHEFSRHHRERFFAWGLPFTTGEYPFYGSDYDPGYYDPGYYDPADGPGDTDPAISGYGRFPGSPRARAFYRTGCRSEDVSVSSSHGPTSVTVTRCSVPMPELPTSK